MDISDLREPRALDAVSVSELNQIIKALFEENRLLCRILVRGEISNFVNHRSGHLYFTLKDADSQIRAVMFRSAAAGLKFIPENGMKVTLTGSVNVYPRDGSYQIYVNSISPDGLGALYVAYEQLKARLEAEGLFDSDLKKPIPRYPRRIGVITSPTGAAVRDIINVIGRRYPLASVYLYPALVQGAGAEESLIRGVDYFDKSGLVDTVIIGRGGGSIEDLWAFNSEALARRIFAAEVPVVSAVGHQTDYTICDFVSDLRAPTPSAAAELSAPDIREIMIRLDDISSSCDRALVGVTERRKERLKYLCASRIFLHPEELFEKKKTEIGRSRKRADSAIESTVEFKSVSFAGRVEKINALNPLSVLSRGFSVTEHNGSVLKNAEDVSLGESIKVRLSRGTLLATVDDKSF